jgi:hypothetical protein
MHHHDIVDVVVGAFDTIIELFEFACRSLVRDGFDAKALV